MKKCIFLIWAFSSVAVAQQMQPNERARLLIQQGQQYQAFMCANYPQQAIAQRIPCPKILPQTLLNPMPNDPPLEIQKKTTELTK